MTIDTLLSSMKKISQKQRGFTIVELLIVIVVVAILAAITVTAYNGIQQRGRDAQRVSDMNTIVKALEMYKVQTGNYPVANGTNEIAGWEVSSKNPHQFLLPLKTAGIISGVPVDPVNDTTAGIYYKYYRYSAGSNGCDTARGDYYILIVRDAESTANQLSSSPGFQCPGRNWSTEGGWVTGAYSK
jgi:type II secretion system protein G